MIERHGVLEQERLDQTVQVMSGRLAGSDDLTDGVVAEGHRKNQSNEDQSEEEQVVPEPHALVVAAGDDGELVPTRDNRH